MALSESELPDGAVVLNRIEIVEYLDADGEYLTADLYWTVDGDIMPLTKKIGLLEQAKVAACIPMIQSAPQHDEED